MKVKCHRSGVRKLLSMGQIDLDTWFLSKIWLEHSYAHLFMDYLWLFSYYNSKIE